MITVKEYFLKNRPDSGKTRFTYVRIANAFDLFCNISMDDLCAMPEEDIRRVRRIGVIAQAAIREECEKYLAGRSHCENIEAGGDE